MRTPRILSAAAASIALLTTPTLASAAAPVSADVRVGESSDGEDELFRSRGGLLAIILIAVVIAIGIYIVVDDDKDEEPASA